MKTILSILILLLGNALAQAEPVPTALKVGDSIPDVTLRTVDNQEVKLQTLVAEKPTVLVFFRGGLLDRFVLLCSVPKRFRAMPLCTRCRERCAQSTPKNLRKRLIVVMTNESKSAKSKQFSRHPAANSLFVTIPRL